jgi:hypothetical protein
MFKYINRTFVGAMATIIAIGTAGAALAGSGVASAATVVQTPGAGTPVVAGGSVDDQPGHTDTTTTTTQVLHRAWPSKYAPPVIAAPARQRL